MSSTNQIKTCFLVDENPSPDGYGKRPRAASDLNELDESTTIYKFVITGGPCAGKTTGMERLMVFLRERGFRVFVVPEAATMLFLNGAYPEDLAKLECQEAFQQFVISTQISLEDSIRNYARSLKQKSVILCDRGIMDGSAYVDDATWTKVLSRQGMDSVAAREGRYDAVFHLVTAADGAVPFYSLSNNNARHEGVEEAKILDRKTQKAWNGHPHHVIIDNRNGRSFERKMEQLVAMVAERVGLPCLTRRRHKFVLNRAPDFTSTENIVGGGLYGLSLQTFDVEKIMLADGLGALPEAGNGGKVLYSFIRKRSQGGFSAYGLTTVKELETGEQVELKQVISSRMYAILKVSADKSRTIIRQRRYCFLWEGQSFHVYQYLAPQEGLWLVYCQCEGDPIIPEFLDVSPHVTGEGVEFSTRELSRIDRPHTPTGMSGGV